MTNLTPRQLAIVQIIQKCRAGQGYSPTLDEIGKELGISKVTVFEHVDALKRKGALVCGGAKHTARSLLVSRAFQSPGEEGFDELVEDLTASIVELEQENSRLREELAMDKTYG